MEWEDCSSPTDMDSISPIPFTSVSIETLGRHSLRELLCCHQCCGSVTFWYGSGSAYPYLWRTDPAIFVSDIQDAFKFLCLLLFEGTFTSFFKDKKVIKKSQNSRNQGFSYYFCLMIEGQPSNVTYWCFKCYSNKQRHSWCGKYIRRKKNIIFQADLKWV